MPAITANGLTFEYDERGLLTVVAQDRLTGELRMLAHANREALQATLAHMKVVEEMRRTLRDIRDVNTIASN